MLQVPGADKLDVSPAMAARSLPIALSALHLWMDQRCLTGVLES